METMKTRAGDPSGADEGARIEGRTIVMKVVNDPVPDLAGGVDYKTRIHGVGGSEVKPAEEMQQKNQGLRRCRLGGVRARARPQSQPTPARVVFPPCRPAPLRFSPPQRSSLKAPKQRVYLSYPPRVSSRRPSESVCRHPAPSARARLRVHVRWSEGAVWRARLLEAPVQKDIPAHCAGRTAH
jgi:hypothetical protein